MLAFPSEAVIPQAIALSVTQFLQQVFVNGHSVERALSETCFTNKQLMQTVGIHLTLQREDGTVKQVVYGYASISSPWGLRMRCPNPDCRGTEVDVQTRTHARQGYNLVLFRCTACLQRTVDYVQRPSWTTQVNKEHRVAEYSMYVNGRPANEALIGRCRMAPWEPQEKKGADAMDTN